MDVKVLESDLKKRPPTEEENTELERRYQAIAKGEMKDDDLFDKEGVKEPEKKPDSDKKKSKEDLEQEAKIEAIKAEMAKVQASKEAFEAEKLSFIESKREAEKKL